MPEDKRLITKDNLSEEDVSKVEDKAPEPIDDDDVINIRFDRRSIYSPGL